MEDRLSDKCPCHTCNKDNKCELSQEACEEYLKWEDDCLKKLSEYETVEEDGRLVILPCKVGDIIYLILDTDDFVDPIIPCIIKQIIIRDYGILLSLLSVDSMIGHAEWHSIDEFGYTFFLTQEEAEKALEEMKIT